MSKITRTPAIERAAVAAVGTVEVPRGKTWAESEQWLADRAGWVHTTTMPSVGAVVLVDAHGKLRTGAVVAVAKTRATVAVTTPTAIDAAAKQGCGLNLVLRPFALSSIYVRKA